MSESDVIGSRDGLKIRCPLDVWVRFPSLAPITISLPEVLSLVGLFIFF